MRWVAAIGLLRHRFGVRPVPPPNALRSPPCTAGRRTREGLSPNAAAGADDSYRCGRSISATPRRLTAKLAEGTHSKRAEFLPGGARPTSTATRAARLRLRSELSVSLQVIIGRPTAQSCRLQPSGTTALRKDGKHWWEEWLTRRRGPNVIVQSVRAIGVGAGSELVGAQASVCEQDFPDARPRVSGSAAGPAASRTSPGPRYPGAAPSLRTCGSVRGRTGPSRRKHRGPSGRCRTR